MLIGDDELIVDDRKFEGTFAGVARRVGFTRCFSLPLFVA